MNPTHIVAYRSRLDNVIALAKATSDDEVRAHLAAYVCVLLCGFVEADIRSILLKHAQARAAPRVLRYTEVSLGWFYNPNFNRICELLKDFDPGWADALKSATDNEVKDGVDSIVANKNNIAHGKSVGVTIVRAERYYKAAQTLLAFLEGLCA